jgi:hypothetical protein
MMTALLVHRRKANAVVAPTVRHFDDFCFSEFQSNRFRSAEAEMTRGKKKKKDRKGSPTSSILLPFSSARCCCDAVFPVSQARVREEMSEPPRQAVVLTRG